MSWHATLDLPHCGECGRSNNIDIGNYTHNTDTMLRTAMAAVGSDFSLYDLHNKTGHEVHNLLRPALVWWSTNMTELRKLNPENGWGSADGGYEYWNNISETCAQNPNGKLWLSG